MEMFLEESGKHAARASSDISSTGFSATKITSLPVIGVQSRFTSDITPSMHTVYKKVKFMCSSSGKILPRPSDMKLRYVGGETRMVSLPRHMSYEDFICKMMELYGPDIIIKYQLPEEDLDALVSVTSDEDLENMMEECDRLSAVDGSSKLRAFIFLASDFNAEVPDEIANFKSSERKFVDAINAISGDTLPVVHITGKHYPTSGSFNDAYKVWNATHSQDGESYISKNPYSEVFPLEAYVSSESGDLGKYKSFIPDQLQSSTSPFSYSAFMGQPVPSHAIGISDIFKNDLGNGTWRDSPSFFGQGVGHSYGGSHWVTASEMSLPTQFANADTREERRYEVDLSFGESSRGDHGSVQVAQDYGQDDSKDETSASYPLPNANDDYTMKILESGDASRHSGGLLQIDPHILSPGALLQRQLTNSPSTAVPSQKQFYSDWPSEELSNSVSRQVYSIASGFVDQPKAFNNHVLPERWEKLPMYEPSFGLGQQDHVFEKVDDLPFSVQVSTAADILPLSSENSAIIFSPDIACSSPPSSPLGWKLQFGKGYQNAPTDDGSCHTSIASVPPMDCKVHLSSGQVSANVLSAGKSTEEILQANVTSLPDQSLRQDTDTSNQILVTEEPYTGLTSQSFDQETLMTDRGWLKTPLNLVKGAVSLPISSDNRINEPTANQNDKYTDQFLVLAENQQALGSSLPTVPPSKLITAASGQHQFDQMDRFSNSEEVLPPAIIEGSYRLDTLSELLSSTRLTECLAATSSAAESFRKSESSADEDLHCEEGEKLGTVVREESTFSANETSDFPLPAQDDFRNFQTTQNSLPLNEQFNNVFVPASPTNFDDGNSSFADASSLRNTQTESRSYPSQVPAFDSLIESWEATLLQDEDRQHLVEHGMQEHEQTQIDSSPRFDIEIEREDSGVEFEEVEEFRQIDHGPMNAAAIAEQEAISRGLQIIRNSDLEELHELGSGTFGTVYHGKWRGTDVAIKRIKSSCFAGRQAERDRLVADFWREAYILGQLHHPNVVAFYGAVPDGPGATLATVTEYMVNGSLKQVLQNKDRTLDRRKRLLIAMDAAFGMEYLHGKNVVHFDMKCENLLVNLRDTQRPICKVGDLGLSKVKQQTFVSSGVRGTLPWMAPELLSGSSGLVSEKVDVFSFGIVMWELLTGEEPYANMHYGAIIGGIVNNTLRPTVPRWCDPAWRSLMEKCWAADPSERPTFLEIARTLRAMEASLAAKGPGQARILEMYQ